MTQIVRWIAHAIESLRGPRENDLPSEVKVALGDVKRICEVISPLIHEYLLRKGYDESMAGCGWRADTFCVVVTRARPPKEDEISEITKMAAPYPLAIEVAPDLRETCKDINRAASALGLEAEVIDDSTNSRAVPDGAQTHIRQTPLPPAGDSFNSVDS